MPPRGRSSSLEEEPTQTSLFASHLLCYSSVNIENIEHGSNIRAVRTPGVDLLKSKIVLEGWRPSSFLYVIEEPVEGVPSVESVVDAHNSGEDTEGYDVVDFLSTEFKTLKEQPEGVAANRRYKLIDGAHRLQAVRELIPELETAGDEKSLQLAERLRNPSAMVFRPMSDGTMVLLASLANTANKDYVPTSYLDRLTCIKRALDLWTAKIEAHNADCKIRGDKKKIRKITNQEFIRDMAEECARIGQTVKDAYGSAEKDMKVQVGMARCVHVGTIAHMKKLLDQDVSTLIFCANMGFLKVVCLGYTIRNYYFCF